MMNKVVLIGKVDWYCGNSGLLRVTRTSGTDDLIPFVMPDGHQDIHSLPTHLTGIGEVRTRNFVDEHGKHKSMFVKLLDWNTYTPPAEQINDVEMEAYIRLTSGTLLTIELTNTVLLEKTNYTIFVRRSVAR